MAISFSPSSAAIASQGAVQKATENGRVLQAASRTPIALDGTLSGQRLELKFTERGTRRTSGGTMVMDVGDDGSLRGSFSSDAAQWPRLPVIA